MLYIVERNHNKHGSLVFTNKKNILIETLKKGTKIMKLYSQEECIENMDKAVKAAKRKYNCQAYIPAIGTKIYNFLEDAYLVTKKEEPVVIIGPAGEEYPIPVDKFLKTYSLPDSSLLSEEWLREQDFWLSGKKMELICNPQSDNYVFALPVDTDCSFTVVTTWNDRLTVNSQMSEHKTGDRIIFAEKDEKPDQNDMWVVNGNVFEKTYKEL
jgi:hypothetical protein